MSSIVIKYVICDELVCDKTGCTPTGNKKRIILDYIEPEWKCDEEEFYEDVDADTFSKDVFEEPYTTDGNEELRFGDC